MDWLSAPRPLIIGHRGASADAPENTLYAFSLAMEQGADGIELDVHLSRDGELVVFHDFTVDRLTGGKGRIADLTLAELQSLALPEQQMIPTLDELFETLGPQPLYNIEIKRGGMWDRGIETAVADCVQSHHLENRVLVSSFSPFSVRRARRALSRATPVALLHYRSLDNFAFLLVSSEVYHPYHALVDEKYMAWAKKRNYSVNVWTVDSPGEAKRLIDLGVAGIITNKPRFLRDSLGL